MFCLSELKDTNRARRQQAGSSDGRWRSTTLEAYNCLWRLGLSSGDKVKGHGPRTNPAQWTENNTPWWRGYIRLKGLLTFRYAAGVIREYVSWVQCLLASDRQQRIPNLPSDPGLPSDCARARPCPDDADSASVEIVSCVPCATWFSPRERSSRCIRHRGRQGLVIGTRTTQIDEDKSVFSSKTVV